MLAKVCYKKTDSVPQTCTAFGSEWFKYQGIQKDEAYKAVVENSNQSIISLNTVSGGQKKERS
jgi:hypothetical protein